MSADSAPPSLYSLYDDVDDDDETIAMIMPEPHDEEEQGSLFGSSQSRFALYVILALCFMAILLSALVGFIVLSASQ